MPFCESPGVPTYSQRWRGSGLCLLRGGFHKFHCTVPTTLFFRVQCLSKVLYKAVEEPSTRPIILLMITGSYFRRRLRLTIFEPDETKFASYMTLLNHRRRPGERFLLKHILETLIHQSWIKAPSMTFELSKCYSKFVKFLTLCQ